MGVNGYLGSPELSSRSCLHTKNANFCLVTGPLRGMSLPVSVWWIMNPLALKDHVALSSLEDTGSPDYSPVWRWQFPCLHHLPSSLLDIVWESNSPGNLRYPNPSITEPPIRWSWPFWVTVHLVQCHLFKDSTWVNTAEAADHQVRVRCKADLQTPSPFAAV